jgi:hypothetical protein
MVSEIRQAQKDKYCIFSVICGIWKNLEQSNPKKQRREMVIRGREDTIVEMKVKRYKA